MVFLINKKFIFSFLMIFVVISTLACVSAVDNSTVDMQQDNQMLYVDSTVDENGNGSEMSPFSSISVAVDNAGNNSHVILKKGIYKVHQTLELL